MDVDVSLDYGLTLLAALLIGTGFVLQQNAAQREPASRFLSLRLITDLLREPRWLAGIALHDRRPGARRLVDREPVARRSWSRC